MGRNVLVRHLLETSLEEIDFLPWGETIVLVHVFQTSNRALRLSPGTNPTYLVLAPCSASARRRRLAVLGDAILMAVHDVRGRRISRGGGHLHSGRHVETRDITSGNGLIFVRGSSFGEMTAERGVLRIEDCSTGLVVRMGRPRCVKNRRSLLFPKGSFV